MPVQIGQKRESDFSDPLGLLSDCHRRIEKFLGVMIKVTGRANGRALDPEERAALANALEYFRNSAPKHTADEEDSLFPRLRARTSLDYLAELESDHHAANRDHQLVDSLGRRWLTEGALAADQALELKDALARLSHMYARHIALEDQELFPLAARLLPAEQLAEVGLEMAKRRSVPPPKVTTK